MILSAIRDKLNEFIVQFIERVQFYNLIKRLWVQFGNKLNEFTELHKRSECNSLNEFNLFPNCNITKTIKYTKLDIKICITKVVNVVDEELIE